MAKTPILDQKNKVYNAIKNLYGVQDSYQNLLANLGVGSISPLTGTNYVYNRKITWNFDLINQMEREQPLLRKIIDYQTSSLLNGIDIVSNDITSDEIKEISERLQNLYAGMYDFIFQAKFYGGGAGMLIFEGDKESTYSQPLDISKIKGKFLGIKPLERWIGINPTGDLIDEIGINDDARLIGQPLYYSVRFGGKRSKSYKVHYSRLLIYNTGTLNFVMKRMEQFWGVSLVERLYDPLNRYNTILNALADKMLIASQRVVKIDESIGNAENDEYVKEVIQNKLSAMSAGLNFSNVLFLDGDDEFEYQQATMSGDSDVLKQMAIDLCASAPAPYSAIFDDGFNDAQATENSHRFVRNEQELFIKDYYIKLIKIIYHELYKKECPNFKVQFQPIRSISEKDRADIVAKATESISTLYKNNIMNKEIAIKSLIEVNDNIRDIFNNFDEEYIKQNGQKTYNEEQMQLAMALNKGKDGNSFVEKEKFGGNNNNEKPTPNVKVGE